jgi:hypothetical protein
MVITTSFRVAQTEENWNKFEPQGFEKAMFKLG